MTQGIAFFDFDDTLARGDSILPFLLYCIRKRIAPRRQLVKAAGAFLYWKLRPSRASRAPSSRRTRTALTPPACIRAMASRMVVSGPTKIGGCRALSPRISPVQPMA